MTKKKSKSKKESEFKDLSLDGLQDKKNEIKEFLASLENDYRNATISEKSYNHSKTVNIKKLEDIIKQLGDFGITEDIADSLPKVDDKKKATSDGADKKDVADSSSETSPSPETPAEPVSDKGDAGSSDASETPAKEDMDSEKSKSTDKKSSSFVGKLKQHFKSSKPESIKSPALVSVSDASSIIHNVETEMHKVSEKVSVELERINASIDSFKEVRASTDERVQSLSEGLVELRTTVFQRETSIKEQEMKFTKVKELVDDIEPEKINKEFLKRDKFTSAMEIRTEKLEVKMQDLIKTINNVNGLLKSIGGLENVAKMDHDISKKKQHIDDVKKDMEHLSSKIEKMFVDMSKKLEDFDVYELRQNNMGEIVDDMVKNVDRLGLKFESYIDKKDLKKVQDNVEGLSKNMDTLGDIIRKAVPFAEAEIPKELQDLKNQREDIETLMSSLEVEHSKKHIKDKEYKSIKLKNEKSLEKINKRITKIMDKIKKNDYVPPKELPEEIKGAGGDAGDGGVKESGDVVPNAEGSDVDVKEDGSSSDEKKSDKKDENKDETDIDNDKDNEKDSVDDSKIDDKSSEKKEDSVKSEDVSDDEADVGSDDGKNKSKENTPVKSSSDAEMKPESEKKVDIETENKKDKVSEIKAETSAEKETIVVDEAKNETSKKLVSTDDSSVKKDDSEKSNIDSDKTDSESEKKSDDKKNEDKSEDIDPLLEELEDSLKQGLISKETYDTTKKLLMS